MATDSSMYVDEAINRLRQRTAQTRASTADVAPGSGAAPTQVNDATKPRSLIGRARQTGGKALKFAGSKVLAPAAAGGAVLDQAAPDSTARYAERFGMDEPTGDGSFSDIAKFAALRGLGFASDLGNRLTLGAAGNLYRDDPGAAENNNGAMREASAATNDEPVTQHVGQQPTEQPVNATTNQPVQNPAEPSQVSRQDQAGNEKTGPNDTPSADGEVDLGAMLDNPKYVPEKGRGIVRNNRTGRTFGVQGEPGQQQAQPDQQQTMNERVDMPNPALLTDASSIPEYLAQYGAASQTAADNRAATSDRKGMIARRRANQEAAQGEQTLEKGNIELEQLNDLQQVLDQYQQLNEQNDPDGSQRQQLQSLALTLQGKNPDSPYEFKTMKGVADDGYTPTQDVIRVNPQTGQAELVNPNQAAQPTTASPANTQQLPPKNKRKEGQTYDTPRGPAIWRGNGWELVNAAE